METRLSGNVVGAHPDEPSIATAGVVHDLGNLIQIVHDPGRRDRRFVRVCADDIAGKTGFHLNLLDGVLRGAGGGAPRSGRHQAAAAAAVCSTG